MVRRIAITLATVAAAGFVAAAPAAAGDWEGGQLGAAYQSVEGSRQAGEFVNLGGPYGITFAKENKAHFESVDAYLWAEYAHGH
ncbi:hypothetical protein [Streptomyces halstedii]|uniref:hypothetical protein n=1 Tax=Streptomyces halstedii TaxID=1944 RepID=UPI003253706E